MRFTTTAVSALALLLSIATFSPSVSAAQTPCDHCVEDTFIKIQPACANLPQIGDYRNFTDAKLTDQHRKCYCSIPGDDTWYQHCLAADKCSPAHMSMFADVFSTLKRITVCPAAGGSANAAPSGGANTNTTTGGANTNAGGSGNGSSSSKMVGATAGMTIAAAAILSALL
ncbi:hypothetical protein BGX23_012526 [Mortierella sp. AD031]|nr:hypothetical protein BGX23_012526 [Mortierella sp. AD031]KAG0208337.1 hypothetical protein BGX33_006310 [Mortierella sp. NVP41]